MSVGIALEELLAWNIESADFWKAKFDANPALLELTCGIDGAPNVQEFVRHIWIAELRWAQRVAGVPVTERADLPKGPLDALFGLHIQAVEMFNTLLKDPGHDWNETFKLELDWLPPQAQTISRRKMAAHALLHGVRHWAQLATLLREAGFPTDFMGDLIFSLALA
jgi:uncharacterized damage-inducible protein DinB